MALFMYCFAEGECKRGGEEALLAQPSEIYSDLTSQNYDPRRSKQLVPTLVSASLFERE